jgi:hypothetical protein
MYVQPTFFFFSHSAHPREIFVDEVRKTVKRLSSQFMGEPEKEILEIII